MVKLRVLIHVTDTFVHAYVGKETGSKNLSKGK